MSGTTTGAVFIIIVIVIIIGIVGVSAALELLKIIFCLKLKHLFIFDLHTFSADENAQEANSYTFVLILEKRERVDWWMDR